MSDNQSDNSWGVDMNNHPTIHTNRFGDNTTAKQRAEKAAADEVLRERELHSRAYAATHHTSYVEDIPVIPHYAVLEETSFTYDDGYGDRGQSSTSTAHSLNYITFDTQEALETWVLKNKDKKFKVLWIEPVKVEVKAVITMSKV